jgi:hypothetical protein
MGGEFKYGKVVVNNFCKCLNVPPPSTAIIKEKIWKTKMNTMKKRICAS